jgi:hypothetical protein
VTGVFVEGSAQVPFAEDEHAVGDLTADGEHEPLRVRVRARAARRSLADGDTGVGEHGVEGIGELAGPVADEDLEPVGSVAEVHEQVSGLLGGPRPIRVGGDAEVCAYRLPTSRTKNTYRRCSVRAQSTWKKSQASIVDAWLARNRRQVVWSHRVGAGGMPSRWRMRRIVEALIRWPRPCNSP